MRHRLDRRRPVLAALLSLFGLLLAVAPIEAATPGAIVVLPTTGEVDSVMADTLASELDAAAASGAAAVVIRLDTPGGSLEATQQIVTSLLDSPGPDDRVGRPGRRLCGQRRDVHHARREPRLDGARNPDWRGVPDRWLRQRHPGRARREGPQRRDRLGDVHRRGSPSARRLGRLDRCKRPLVVGPGGRVGRARWTGSHPRSRRSSPRRTAGPSQVAGRDVVLAIAGAPIEEATTNPLGGILRLLVDPNIAFLLFTIGALALLFEVQNPNLLTGIFGVVAIALATVGFVNLPTDLIGLLLVALGLVLFALEPSIPSHGVLTIGGATAFVVGGFALYSQADQFGPAVRVAVPLLIGSAVTAAAFGLLIAATAIRTREMAGPLDPQPAVPATGTLGEVRRPLEPIGSIYAKGEEWSARTPDDRPLPRGTPVHVVGSDGLIVVVEPEPSGLR